MSRIDLPAWQRLTQAADHSSQRTILELFQQDPNRVDDFSATACGIHLDFSKNNLGRNTLNHLLELASARELGAWMTRQRNGDPINSTEDRSVLHTALRQSRNSPPPSMQPDALDKVHQTLDAMLEFVALIHKGTLRGSTDKPFKSIINIGIGGSDLGPRFVVDALRNHHVPNLKCHFVSNVDDAELHAVLEQVDPETTLFLVASKTFTTQETLLNAHSARRWLVDHLGEAAVAEHFAALSSNSDEVAKFGIPPQRQFPFWDWVGGRYSLWSAIGLSIALSIGASNFRDLLAGAEAMDQHFYNTPFERNLPVLLALVGIWNINFQHHVNLAVLPYDERLRYFPNFLQQLDMESNGKSVDRDDQTVSYQTGPSLWGGPGTNVQHSFMQSLHQGTQVIPVDFIAVKNNPKASTSHRQTLLANCFAQSEALLQGRKDANLPPHRNMPGNRPSNTLLLDDITPHTLGSLIALYEHKVFVQGIIWHINSFDQWGVELGKQLGKLILNELHGEPDPDRHDASTNALIGAVKNV